MALPNVNISFANGLLGQVASGDDGLTAVICIGDATHTSTPTIDTDPDSGYYRITSEKGIDQLGIRGSAESKYKDKILEVFIKEFYEEAGEGTPLYIYNTNSSAGTPDGWFGVGGIADAAILATQGKLRNLVVIGDGNFTGTKTYAAGLWDKTSLALTAADIWIERQRDDNKCPVSLLMAPVISNTVSLADLKVMTRNRVSFIVGYDSQYWTDNSTNHPEVRSCAGAFAGREAAVQVHVNPGRVKDGALAISKLQYPGGGDTDNAKAEALHDYGYITLRTYVGKAGYYFTDAPTIAADTDDYNSRPRNRCVDKAFRIAYTTLINELLDSVPVNADGTIQSGYAKAIEALVESAIANSMTAAGELSEVDGDRGVRAVVDTTVSLTATSRMELKLRIRPFGYIKFIEIDLGLSSSLN